MLFFFTLQVCCVLFLTWSYPPIQIIINSLSLRFHSKRFAEIPVFIQLCLIFALFNYDIIRIGVSDLHQLYLLALGSHICFHLALSLRCLIGVVFPAPESLCLRFLAVLLLQPFIRIGAF